MRVYTIGHSTRSLDELVLLLKQSGVRTLVDIRRYPGSRKFPHFSRDVLAAELPKRGVEYVHMPELGGRRRPLPDSPNDGLRNEQFRGYADYMGTQEFADAIDNLLTIAGPLAVMCAEAVPWRCHRNMVADELTRRGIEVVHILGAGERKRHDMNPLAVERDGRLLYPKPL